jgi:hypothetical protein
MISDRSHFFIPRKCYTTTTIYLTDNLREMLGPSIVSDCQLPALYS